ncbi:MAG: hypothetical protein H7A36_06455 [Chlamydiales bacterium]|nr:hypothetical protein [Chlamydiales bacterium]
MGNISLSIRAASQIALLGAITKNLRAVNIVYDDISMQINFYYENIKNEEEEIAEIFASEMLSYFENYDINVNSIILPTSKSIPEEGLRVFSRKE